MKIEDRAKITVHSDFCATLTMNAALEVKSTRLEALSIRLKSADVAELQLALAKRFARAADFARMPFILDLNEFSAPEALPIERIVATVQGFGLRILALEHSNPAFAAAAQQAGLAFLGDAHDRAAPAASYERLSPDERPLPEAHALPPEHPKTPESTPRESLSGSLEITAAPVSRFDKTLVVERPVRSGQQVYAPSADLIVTAMVSEGAELIADGNIHVYGTMRGRAQAGAEGDVNARIFIQNMQAQLVSIAGVYRTFEQRLPESLSHKAVHVYLEEGRLVLRALAP